MPQFPEEVTEVVALDPSEGVIKRSKKYIGKALIPVTFVKESAETMTFDDDELDNVVSTLTLCTVSDLRASLKEIMRVLKSKGNFYFLEHVAASDRTDRRLQDLLNPVNNVPPHLIVTFQGGTL